MPHCTATIDKQRRSRSRERRLQSGLNRNHLRSPLGTAPLPLSQGGIFTSRHCYSQHGPSRSGFREIVCR